jgi:hypothetical protein
VIALVALCALAGAEPPAATPADELRTALELVYAPGEFGREETRLTWRRIHPESEAEENTFAPRGRGIIGIVLFALVAAAAAALLGVLAIGLWRRQAEDALADAGAASAAPATLFGLDVRPESLPKDLADAAAAAWAGGDAQLAMSLLYRGALAFVVRRGTAVPASATEGECVERVATHLGKDIAAALALLTAAWQHTAYGRRPPSGIVFSHIVQSWRPHLEARE